MSASTPVEAQSLSALTNLFANPPQYPRNPTHQVNEPLVLYIVRVPGSKDVFLSPVKPPTKASISLDAIQSSLYYFHVNTPEDEEVKRSLDQQRKSDEVGRQSASIPRKPLPPTPFARHPLPPPPEEEEQEQCQQYMPYRLQDSQTASLAEQRSDLRLNTNVDTGAHRKRLSPADPLNIHNATGDYALSPVWGSQGLHSSHNTVHATSQASVHGHAPSDYGLRNHTYRSNSLAAPTALEVARRTDRNFMPITVIRRDPASGTQWNIGTINLLEPSFTGSNIRPVSVELTTPGYGRFARNTGFDTPRPGSACSDAASIRRAMESSTFFPAAGGGPDTPLVPFNRVIDFRKMALSDLRRTVYQRSNSSDSIGNFKTDASKPGLERNVLAFTSPWHGTCTFINGIDGNSLKIKHTIASTSSNAEGLTNNIGELRFNLGFSILGIKSKEARRQQNESESDKIPIPKLLETKKENFRKSFQQLKNRSRESFQKGKVSTSTDSSNQEDALRDLSNVRTPTTNNLNDRAYPSINGPDGDGRVSRGSTHYNDYSNPSTRPASSEDNEDEQHRLSLRLGRERAGGGFRGQSAKLGKLIIEDEGLKMCDLVVGAAMGVWWQHYER